MAVSGAGGADEGASGGVAGTDMGGEDGGLPTPGIPRMPICGGNGAGATGGATVAGAGGGAAVRSSAVSWGSVSLIL